jgi:DNA repair exonuclease SbcCD ATPase subunit
MKMGSSDPIGTLGAGKGTPRELDVALEGGPDFINRLKTLAAAKDEAAQAYARLKIGNDVLAAREDAEEQLRRAEEQLRRAEETKTAADEYSEKARKEADAYVTVVRRDAETYAARLHEEIDVAKSHAEEAKLSALTAQAHANQNKAEAEKLIAENIDKQQALDARTAKFKSGLLELKREFGDDGDELVVPPFTEGELRALNAGGRSLGRA